MPSNSRRRERASSPQGTSNFLDEIGGKTREYDNVTRALITEAPDQAPVWVYRFVPPLSLIRMLTFLLDPAMGLDIEF